MSDDLDNVDTENDFILKDQSRKKKKGKASLDKDSSGNLFYWCHQCKQKHVEVLCCTKTCSKKYCTRCVWRHYKEKVDDADKDNWVCFYCQGLCSCAFCRRRRAKETNTKFESHRGKKRMNPIEPVQQRKKKKTSVGPKIEDSQVVEKIIARSKSYDKTTYLLKIKEESDATWVPEQELPQNISTKFSSSDILTFPSDIVHSAISELSIKPTFPEQTFEEPLESEKVPLLVPEKPNGKSTDNLPHARKKLSALNALAHQSDSPRKDNQKANLKNILSSGILKEGDELSCQNMDENAILLKNGRIQWKGETFKTFSDFTRTAFEQTNCKDQIGKNSWRLVYCKGKPLQYYLFQFRRLHTKHREVPEVIKEEPVRDKIVKQKLEVIIPKVHKETIEEKPQDINLFQVAATPTPEDLPTTNHDVDSYSQKLFAPLQLHINDFYPQHDHNMWIENINYDNFDTLMSCVNDDFDNHDQLICGNQDKYLDIRDKDFFNVNSTDYDYGVPRSYSFEKILETDMFHPSQVL